MVDELERISKDAMMTKSRYCLCICLKSEENHESVSQDSPCPGQYSKQASPEFKCTALQVHQGLLHVDTGFAS